MRPLWFIRALTSRFLTYYDENGEVIDDSIINKLAKKNFMVVVNAGMGGRVAEHLNANKGEREVEITDQRSNFTR